jgi:hypothetical protein
MYIQITVSQKDKPNEIFHISGDINSSTSITVEDGTITISSKSLAEDGISYKQINTVYTNTSNIKAKPAKSNNLIILREGLNFKSSMINTLTYDPDHGSLGVQFKKQKHVNNLYLYEDVSMDLFTKLLFADSIGGYFNREIKTPRNDSFRMVEFNKYVSDRKK